MRNSNPSFRVVARPVEELSDAQIEHLIAVGKREADLIDQMEEAVRHGDRNLVWQIAQALVRVHDEAKT